MSVKEHRHQILQDWRHPFGDPEVDMRQVLSRLAHARTHLAMTAIEDDLRALAL